MGCAAARRRGPRRAVGRRRLLPGACMGGDPGRSRGPPRCTRCRRCSSSGSTRRRSRHGGRSRSSPRTADGSTTGSATSTARSSRASTAARSRPAPTSASTSRRSSTRILGERLADGGWNCEAENGSVRSSFDTTINVLDGLLAFEQATGGSAGGGGPAHGRGVPARARPVPSQEHGRASRSGLPRVRVPVLLALRRAAGARLLPPHRAPPIRGWPRRSRSCGRSQHPTAAGSSTASIPVGCISSSTTASARRAGGTPSGRCACSAGGTVRAARTNRVAAPS